MEQVIQYQSEILALEKQGVPIDWRQVAQVMANMLSAEVAKQVPEKAD